MIGAIWLRLRQKLLLVPVVAIASYFLMATLPLPTGEEAKRELPEELLRAYREDLGLGQPLGFLRPWVKLFRGQRLGTSAQGVTGGELLQKLSGSLLVGAIGLCFALGLAIAFALLRVRARRERSLGASELIPAVAFGTPVFIPALLLAPSVVEAGHLLPEIAAAFVVSIWPGVLLGTLLGDALFLEGSRDYVRTARAKGLDERRILFRHVLPNVWPTLLDSLPPIATALLAGSFAAERVFGLPYFGQLYVLAVLQKQVAVSVVATTLFASLLVLVTAAVEVLRLWIDPRARDRSLA